MRALGTEKRRMSSCEPATHPKGKPPPRILPKVTRSARTPKYCCAPPSASRKPVMTSSSSPFRVNGVLRRVEAHAPSPGRPG